ncbi:MAG: hypothetical protein LBI87_05300 [Candidatus Accumulibacter sp.]|jgi:hypothetical protein|nr:hypothetical protein [Accumulibacter sp.]
MKHDLFRDLAGVFDLTPRSYHLDRSGFATDARNLRGDHAAICRDLENTLKREPTDKRARQK